MPRTRKEVRLPEAIYVNRLANVGVDIAPEQMIERAIAQGILPPALLKQAVLEDFIPSQRAR
jgi:hypothetical protein